MSSPTRVVASPKLRSQTLRGGGVKGRPTNISIDSKKTNNSSAVQRQGTYAQGGGAAGGGGSAFGRKDSGSNRTDFLHNLRKPSSQAFPLMNNVVENSAIISKEDLYDFENKLRDVIAELTKPIYDKIQDTLSSLRTVKTSQDEVSRQTKELQFEIQSFSQFGNKMDDLKTRIDENETNIQNIYMKASKNISTVQKDFDTLKTDFKREEEQSRIARKGADSLQEEYCRIVHSVATEKQRNLMFIERAKREFITEITAMGQKVAKIENIKNQLDSIEERIEKKDQAVTTFLETKLVEQKVKIDRKVEELQAKEAKTQELVAQVNRSLDMFKRETNRLDKEIKNTDFFLNKVQPVSTFTNTITLMKSIIDDEDQLQRITDCQNQFFAEISGDTDLLAELDKASKSRHKAQESQEDSVDNFSPHYDRLLLSINEMTKSSKQLGGDQAQPSGLLIDTDLKKFERLLKKVQNHRSIVKTYETKFDAGGNQLPSSAAESVQIDGTSQDSPQVIFIKGERTLLSKVNDKDDAMAVGNRRSQSELKNQQDEVLKKENTMINLTAKKSEMGVGLNFKNPLSLDLIGLDSAVEADKGGMANKKNLVRMSGKKSARSVARSEHSSKRRTTNRSRAGVGGQGCLTPSVKKLGSEKTPQASSSGGPASYEKASELSSKDFKNLKQYEMTQEKYEASEQALQCFSKRFSIRSNVLDKVHAFKAGLIDIYATSGSPAGPGLAPNQAGLKSKPHLGTNKPNLDTSKHTGKAKPQTKVLLNDKSDESSQKSQSIKHPNILIVGNSEEGIAAQQTPNEILKSYIGQQQKLNELHGALVKNILEDKAEQYEQAAEEEYSGSRKSSDSGSTSSMQDELEAMDSVEVGMKIIPSATKLATVNEQNLNKGSCSPKGIGAHSNLNVLEPLKLSQPGAGAGAASLTHRKYSRAESGPSFNDHDRYSRQSRLNSQEGGGSDMMGSSHRAHGVRLLSNVNLPSSESKGGRNDYQGMKSALSKGTRIKSRRGSSQKSKRTTMVRGLGINRMPGGGGKDMTLFKKDMEKKVKKQIAETRLNLSEEQVLQVNQLLQAQFQTLQTDFNTQFEATAQKNVELSEKIDIEVQRMQELSDLVSQTEDHFSKMQEEFSDQKERYDVAIHKMVKDKRAMVQMHDEQVRMTTKNTRVINVLHMFIAEVAMRVNQLLMAEEIEVRLYAQDEKDKKQTVLYGLNNEATSGMGDLQAQSPIQVNNNCLSCSGNASFIRKAFKIACLSYSSSKVTYQNEEHTREALLDRRRNMIKTAPKLSVDHFNHAIRQEEVRLNLLNEQERTMRVDLSDHFRNSYKDFKMPFNKVADKAESMTSVNFDAKMLSFRDVNNSLINSNGLGGNGNAHMDNNTLSGTLTGNNARDTNPNGKQMTFTETTPITLRKTENGSAEFARSSKETTPVRLYRRNVSATMSKKGQTPTSSHIKDFANTLPMVSPATVSERPDSTDAPKKQTNSFHERKQTIDQSVIKIGLEGSHEPSHRRNLTKTMPQTDQPQLPEAAIPGTVLNHDSSSFGLSTRISQANKNQLQASGSVNRDGLLSGRVPETNQAPFATLDTSAIKQGRLDTQRFGSKKMFASPKTAATTSNQATTTTKQNVRDFKSPGDGVAAGLTVSVDSRKPKNIRRRNLNTLQTPGSAAKKSGAK